MRIKCVYILTSDRTDFYYEQTLLSACSLRYYNPDATIIVVADHLTYLSLEASRSGLDKYVNQIICVQAPEGLSKMHRSRYLKTNLRSFVDGDYLFIDSDTIICDSLGGIDSFKCEMGAVADINDSLPLLHDQTVIARCEAAGFNNLEGQPYFNSGVMFVKDTPNTHLFYKEWFENWKSSVAKGIAFDQPALCQTNVQLGKPIQELPGVWNCQFKMGGYPYLRDAKIMHYYSNNGESQLSPQLEMLFSKIKASGLIDEGIMNLVSNPKTLFYSFLDMNQDLAFKYLTSDLLSLFYMSPSVFKPVERVGAILDGISRRLKKVLKSKSF